MLLDWCTFVLVAAPILLVHGAAVYAFVSPTGRSASFPANSMAAAGRCCSHRRETALGPPGCEHVASRQGSLRPTTTTGLCSTRRGASGCDRASNRKKTPPQSGGNLPNTSSPNSNGGGTPAGAKRPAGRPPSRLAATATKSGREVLVDITDPGPEDTDVNVLVPVKDVVPVPLADISQAAADSLGGGDATRVSMERFCKTLESVFRTEFSVKVDRANASCVLGGGRDRTTAGRGSRGAGGGGAGGGELLQAPQPQAGQRTKEGAAKGEGSTGGDKRPGTAMATANGGLKNAGENGKSKRSKWRDSLRRKKKSKADASGDVGEAPPAPAAVVVAGKRRRRRSGRGKKRNGRGDDSRRIADRSDEAAVVPLLELVDELVRNAMFSPIGARDVMMSQALAAEFPTAAGVRPVFGSLANVYELLRRRCRDVEGEAANDSRGEDAAAAAKRIRDSERAMLPFEGRLLVFWRGNGVEETRGRLLLKKLDYLQSNAVGWLSQSVTDSLKAGQQQVVGAVDTVARDLARRKDSVVRSLAEGAIAFGLERDSLTKFLPVSNVTEMALTKEQEALDEALEALRRNSRRGPVNLERYGLREVNVKLQEFSEGGAWPPGDDSWFWEPEVPAAADTTAAAGQESTKDGVLDKGAGMGELPFPGEVPSTVLPRVTLAAVLSPSRLSPSGKSASTATTTSRNSSNSLGQIGPESEPRSNESSRSALSRLLSKCTVKEPTYDEVVVVYFKRTRRSIFKTPATLAAVLRAGTRIGNKVRGVEKVDAAQDDADEVKAAGLGLQLRVYRGVPLVNLNSIAPDKKVEVRPQTALRLDLNTVVGLGLVLANLRFDSPVLVAAATVSVVLLVIRTIVGYLNARIRVESFVSRDILDKTMGSNVPVLRHLAEEAAQQKSRHVAMVYASLLQCAIDTAPEPAASGAASEFEWDNLAAVSIAAVSRHCDTMMKACVALPWEAKLDVPYWLKELENLKILVRLDEPGREGGGDPNTDKDDSRSLPLALEDLSMTPASAVTAPTAPPEAKPPGGTAVGSSAVVSYRLLDPEAAVEQLKSIWSELVEPPAERFSDAGSRGSGEPSTPWRRVGGAID